MAWNRILLNIFTYIFFHSRYNFFLLSLFTRILHSFHLMKEGKLMFIGIARFTKKMCRLPYNIPLSKSSIILNQLGFIGSGFDGFFSSPTKFVLIKLHVLVLVVENNAKERELTLTHTHPYAHPYTNCGNMWHTLDRTGWRSFNRYNFFYRLRNLNCLQQKQ